MKETNPKDAVGVRKAPLSTVPAGVLMELGVAMLEGARKYGRHNYRVAGIRASVYYDGTMRHMMDWWEGVDIDPDSGISHITKAIAGLVVLRDAMMNDKWTDDRPPRLPAFWLASLNARTGDVIDKHPHPMDPITEAAACRVVAGSDNELLTETTAPLEELGLAAVECGCVPCALGYPEQHIEPTVRIQGRDVPVSAFDKPKGWNAAYGPGAGYEDRPAPGDIVELTDGDEGSLSVSRFLGEDRFELYDPSRAKRRVFWDLQPLPEDKDDFDEQFDAKLAQPAPMERRGDVDG